MNVWFWKIILPVKRRQKKMSIAKTFFVISSHVVFARDGRDIHGTVHILNSYLNKRAIAHAFIKHSLYEGHRSDIEEYKRGKVSSYQAGFFTNLPFPFRLLQESIITLWYLRRKRAGLFIGVDPLNAFLGVVGKKLGWVKKTVFFTPDYTPQRFRNPLLNYLYHRIDEFTALRSDQVWNVSTRILAVRKKQGIANERNFFVPNSPDFSKVERLPFEKINRHDVVIVGDITKALDYEMVIDAIGNLAKKYRDIRLLIIGIGNYLEVLQKLVGKKKLDQHILFLGLKDHKELMKILSKSAVGIAPYSGKYGWNYYGDSMKTREYLATGLPVIISDVPATAGDIRKAEAGFVIKNEQAALMDAVEELFSDQKLYFEMRRNAIKLAQKHDFVRVVDNVLEKLDVV